MEYKIKLETIKNSKNQDTIKATFYRKKSRAWAAAPSGTSAGKHEAVSMPKPPHSLIKNANRHLHTLEGIESQQEFDSTLRRIDGTNNFSNLGASVSIALSLAYAKFSSAIKNKELFQTSKRPRIPWQLGLLIAGGTHGKQSIDIQEILALPKTKDPIDSIQANQQLYAITQQAIKKRVPGYKPRLDLEGGYLVNTTNENALEIAQEAIDKYMENHNTKIHLGVDVAASELWNERTKKYKYAHQSLTTIEQLQYIHDLQKQHKLYYIEDPFNEEDFTTHAKLTKSIGAKAMVCGDDLTTTNTERLKKAIKAKSINAIIIKPNQIGTVTQAHEAVELAKKHKITPVMSHRSGETRDPIIAQLCVAWDIPIIKISNKGPTREAKLNELNHIAKKIK
ncbi:MAG: hypothetical protein J4432_02270 [DPANN group archaeon]|nr:hypothetical protein [DPANN group archaeon]